MKEYTLSVDFKTNQIYGEEITLVQNDYNSTKFNFEFDSFYDNYTKVFELKYPSGKKWIKEIIDNEIILADYDENGNIIPILIESRDYEYEIVLYDGNSKLTHSATGTFYVREELVKTADKEIELETEYPILDQLIQETIELKEDYEKVVEQGNYAEEQGKFAQQQGENVQSDIKNIRNIADEANEKSATAISISKGANQALDYLNYQNMITNFNAFEKEKFITGQQVMIKTLNVPDMWIYQLSEEYEYYTYTTDEEVIKLLLSDSGFHVGYYVLSALETQKVDLTNYIKNTDFASSTKAGIVKMWTSTNEDGEIGLNISTEV